MISKPKSTNTTPKNISPLPQCPNINCRQGLGQTGLVTSPIIKKGYFVTKWNHQPVWRYQCISCLKTFSTHTRRDTYRQKKPYLNQSIFEWYCSGVTLRRMAIVLRTTRNTVIKKFHFLSELARKKHEEHVRVGLLKTNKIQFDEMETFEHTKLKPLSISLSIDAIVGAPGSAH